MRPYELLVIFGPHIEGDEVVNGQLQSICDVITGNGGQVADVTKWGKRRLAYEINRITEGYYAVIDFHAEEEATRAVEHSLKLSDDVLRHLLIRKNEVETTAANASSS